VGVGKRRGGWAPSVYTLRCMDRARRVTVAAELALVMRASTAP